MFLVILFVQVEDYRNSTMIDCIMAISSDTLVLVDSSSKVRQMNVLILIFSG
jgi:hypothetical protein